MSEKAIGCGRPTGGVLGAKTPAPADDSPPTMEKTMEIARVGKPAPDFAAPAFVDGGFKTITLSEYLGKWTVLCFYPGDFTFV